LTSITLLKPRLDLGFNPKNPLSGPVTSFFKHWETFLSIVEHTYLQNKKVHLKIIELPLWEITSEKCKSIDSDILLVPHHNEVSFKKTNIKTFFYMQTPIPYLFTIDSKGWGAGTSNYPYKLLDNNNDSIYTKLQERILLNESKIHQPDYKQLNLPNEYILFACQLPKDKVIKYYSTISVEAALLKTCIATKKLNIQLVVKPHPSLFLPGNEKDLQILHNLTTMFKHTIWIENASIHQLIENAKIVCVVNSGTGLEALLHKKPVITFGRSEYDCVSNHVNETYDITYHINNAYFDEGKTISFFNTWYNFCYDNNNISSFSKLPM
jgi:CDP-glycerol glycerophosphotransferase (TagB/SpsB family)